ncbi:MAG: helix-turn-helix domain-containing protein [Oscillospiraceae bacterium]|nr:helix-turn-helix domain-containing protein [Oscillospiraceae bacterium]
MILKIGDKIRELRKRDGRTQENLAEALGITCQAVSRWEQNAAYPDMELIPSVANYFGISIDELFGYECTRDKKVDEIIARVDAYGIKACGDSDWVGECLALLREGLAEFPQNEKLMITLAETLSEAGWRCCGEHTYYGSDGYSRHDCGEHRKNEYWTEAVRLCERLVSTSCGNDIFTRAVRVLVLLYRNFGEYDKAAEYAKRMPTIENSREMLLAVSADGKDEARYIGEALLKTASEFSRLLLGGLMVNEHNYDTDMPIEKINGLISLFSLVCDDGNFGEYNGQLIQLYLYLSRIQWTKGYRDETFVSLNKALEHARALEKLLDGGEHYFTAPLISLVKCRSGEPAKIAASLPDDGAFWSRPDFSRAEMEIRADPRYAEWFRKTQA